MRDSEFGRGRYDQNKPKCSVFTGSQLVDLVDKKYEILIKIFLEEKGVHEKKKWCTILSLDEEDITKTSPSAPYSSLLL